MIKKVLLIEDDRALRENTAELLDLSGYLTATAPNGRAGVEKAHSFAPDVIICDIMMPELDGYGVLKELSADDRTKHIPFIFLSAKTEHGEIRKGMDLGADDYLTKPFEESELLSAIESRLAKSQLLAQRFAQGPRQSEISEGELRTLAELRTFFDDHGDILEFGEGQSIYGEGSRGDRIFLVMQGLVKCHTMDEDGKELITSLYHANDFLGFTSFLNNVPHKESATAVAPVILSGIGRDQLRSLLQRNHSLSLELVELLTRNITEVKAQLLQMAYSSVRRKTARTLIQFSEVMCQHGDDPIKISRYDLASVAGIATESLIRTLSQFKKEGLITIEGRNITIQKAKALQNIV